MAFLTQMSPFYDVDKSVEKSYINIKPTLKVRTTIDSREPVECGVNASSEISSAP